jgi:hypothetical protein
MPRLSDQERQEVMRYLEADQPLPEKYRFLLFEDKRQVELVWNGKTNTVCNVVLPFRMPAGSIRSRAARSRSPRPCPWRLPH